MNLDGNFPSYEKQQETIVLLQELGVDVDALLAQLGSQTSAASNATSGNAHAKLNWLLATLATVNTNTATANLGTPTTAASNAVSAPAHAKLNWMLANMPTGIIKSVQRGQTFMGVGTTKITIPISSINANKSLLFFSVKSNASSSSSSYMTVAVGGQIDNNVNVSFEKNSLSEGATIYWQVVEFY